MGAPLDVIVYILILGEPKSGWPDTVVVDSGDHKMYEEQSLWLKNAVAYNVDHCLRYNHTLAVINMKGPDFSDKQKRNCETNPRNEQDPNARVNCYRASHRENCTWRKMSWLLEKLLENVAQYLLFVDCDAIIKTRPNHDTVSSMIDVMNSRNDTHMMLANEDWQCLEKKQPLDKCALTTNTGVMLVRNTDWTKQFLTEIVKRQSLRQCPTNEQSCFRNMYNQDYKGAKNHIYISSGLQWNRHGLRPKNDWIDKDEAEIVHFMGAAKPGLQHIAVPSLGLCDYDLCVNVSQCALQASLLRGGLGKVGVVWADDLERPEGQRLHNFKELGSIVSVLKEIKNAEMALLVPEDKIAKHPLTAGEIEKLREHGITKIHYAEWMVDAPRLGDLFLLLCWLDSTKCIPTSANFTVPSHVRDVWVEPLLLSMYYLSSCWLILYTMLKVSQAASPQPCLLDCPLPGKVDEDCRTCGRSGCTPIAMQCIRKVFGNNEYATPQADGSHSGQTSSSQPQH
eukprot:m.243376 g.243376  ORF g.243376 m.243376 type:complete len:509 (-) comp16097_c0_seq53:579-2105(-)